MPLDTTYPLRAKTVKICLIYHILYNKIAKISLNEINQDMVVQWLKISLWKSRKQGVKPLGLVCG